MRTTVMCMALVAAGLSPVAIAQNQLDPNLNPGAAPLPRIASGADISGQGMVSPTAAWGSHQGVTWIPATEFNAKVHASDPDLDYDGYFFFHSPMPAGTYARYFAQLDVEPGKLISHLSCDYKDSSPTENILFEWQKYILDFDSGNTTAEIVDSFVSSGTPGVSYSSLVGTQTMHVYDQLADDLINHHIAVELGPDTSFVGCFVFWKRQVAPGPATATFNDVPTTSPFFKFVEALNSSGVTSGCGNGNFCPNAPLTRAQMAVYLAEALGMGYPY